MPAEHRNLPSNLNGKCPPVDKAWVRHTFKPVASGNLPMLMPSCTVKPSKLFPPGSFSKLVQHKLCCKSGCIHNLWVAMLKHTLACHVKYLVATILKPFQQNLICSILANPRNKLNIGIAGRMRI